VEERKWLVKWSCHQCGGRVTEIVNKERRDEIDTKATSWPYCDCRGRLHWNSITPYDPDKFYECERCGALDQRSCGRHDTLCFTCGFWTEKKRPDIKDSHRSLRTPDGHHFWVGDEGKEGEKRYSSTRGHAGRLFRIKFDDGRYVMSTNLWSQGLIPADFREELPPNGRFIGEKEYDGEYTIINR